MLKFLKVLAPIITLLTCAACGGSSSHAQDSGLEFFNPFYGVPDSDFAQLCVIDVRIAPLPEEEFLASLDRIVESTDGGLMYSDMTRRDRVVYVAPVECDNLDTNDAFAPSNYFDKILSITKTRAAENPFIVKLSEYSYYNLTADLDNAAFAAELAFPQPSSKSEARRKVHDLFCILNANVRAQLRYGLPLLHISLRDDSIHYIYNLYPTDSDLVDYLMNRGFDECGVKYRYKVRKLNNEESSELSTIFVEHP